MMHERRGFFRWMLGGTAGLALGFPLTTAGAERATSPLDVEDAWLTALAKRKQKAFLDIRGFALDGSPFRRSLALMNVLTITYGLAPTEVGIAFGAHSGGLAHLLSPAFWTEYDVSGKVAGGLRPDDAAALRTAGPSAASVGVNGVRDLQAKGIYVLACRNTIARWSRELADAHKETPEAVQAKILANLHAGIEPVPAMVAAAVLAQSRGLGYVAME